jgi:hypothetical protein
MMEEEQLELVEFVNRIDLVNLMILETRVLVNLVNLMVPETRALVNLVNLMVPETKGLVNLEIDAPIADHNLYRSILSDYTFKGSLPYLKSLKY